ncbi:MAG: hypothetical protein M1826_001728 [Phylliscum demangeonii]|nr:MAG: hypothetical protein M1826_001728 [Phylliscum demangeonii]
MAHGVDKETRDKASLASLKTFLSGQRRREELELLKLWKALFYCMWMTDTPLVQQRLASDLAGLVQIVPAANVLPFLEAFWTTMAAREWNAVDRLRYVRRRRHMPGHTPRTGVMPVDRLLEPLRRLMQESLTKAIRKQADQLLKDERLAR